MGSVQESEKRMAIYRWVAAFPPDTLERLQAINEAASSAKHVLLALAYAMFDHNIRRVNKLIIQLLLARMRGERNSDSRLIERVNEKLTEIHLAIDWATGKLPLFSPREEGNPACNKFVRNKDAARTAIGG